MRHDKAEPSGGPPPLRWWRGAERTPWENAGVLLAVVLDTFSFIAGLAFFLHYGASAWPVIFPLWGAWLVAAVLLQRWELRKRKEQRDRRVQWEREQAVLHAAR